MGTMFLALNEIGSWVLKSTWQGSVLILLVLAIQRVFQKQLPARWRFALWYVVLLRLLLPVSPGSALSIFNYAALPKMAEARRVGPVPELPTESKAEAPITVTARQRPLTGATPLVSPLLPQAEMQRTPISNFKSQISDINSQGRDFRFYISALWLAGVLILGTSTALGCARAARVLRSAKAITDAEVIRLFDESKKLLNVRRTVCLIESARFASPVLVGFTKPRLVLPVGIVASFKEEELRMIFLHELAHMKRGDILLNWLTTALQAIHWFNPVVWFGFARLRADRELACDALALSAAGERQRTAYGQAIIRVLESFSTARPVSAVSSVSGGVGIMEDHRQLKNRMRMISRFTVSRRWPISAAVLLAVVSIICLTDAQLAPINSSAVAATKDASSGMLFRTVDPSGKPLANVIVQANYIYEDNNERNELRTDANGTVVIPKSAHDFTTSGGLVIWTASPGHVPKRAEWNRYSIPKEYAMILNPAVSISGSVVNLRGQPVSGVEVRLANFDFSTEWRQEKIAFHPTHTVVRTDAAGHWTYPFVPPEAKDPSFVLTHPDYPMTVARAKLPNALTDPNRFVLDRNNAVVGVVLDPAGNPIAGATVREFHNYANRGKPMTKTDANGHFTLNGVSNGSATIIAQADGFAFDIRSFQISGDETGVEFHLEKGKRLSGRVINSAGEPITNAIVGTDADNHGLDPLELELHTDSGGRFEWNSAPDQVLLCYVRVPGCAIQHGLRLGPGEHEIQFKMEKLRELIVSGSVLDAQTSEPVPRFTVRLAEIQNPDFAPESTFIGTAGNNGSFAMPVTTPNNFQQYLVEISAVGYLPQVSSALSLSSGDQQLKFLLKKGRTLEGEIVAADGSTPVIGAQVFLCNATAGVYMDKPAETRDISGDLPQVTTDANGRFHFEPRADAHTIVVVHPSGYLEIPAAEFQKTNRFRLQPYGIIEGTLQVNGKPAAGESVGVSTFIYPWGDGIRNFPPLQLYLTATTDADGRFRFEKVPPGEREIHHTLKRRAGRIGPIPNSNRTFVQVEPGKISRVELGKAGSKLSAKLNWKEGISLSIGSKMFSGSPVHLWVMSRRGNRIFRLWRHS